MSEPMKHGHTMSASEEMLLSMSGFEQKGHVDTIPLTDEDRAAHARAVAAVEELDRNPWISGEGDIQVQPLKPRTVFVPEETDEEHLERWRAAGRPMGRRGFLGTWGRP